MAPGRDRDARTEVSDTTRTLGNGHVFLPGQIVAGRYRVVRFIARGGMGEVYEAYDEKLGLAVALKTLRREYSLDPAALSRFRREVRLAREVAHENLCRVYDLTEHRSIRVGGPDRVVTCLTMQLLDGETLADYIGRNRPVPPSVALPVIGQIAAALDCLHSHGLVHRDLKPGNVMLVRAPGRPPRAVLMDFGLAKPALSSDQFETFDAAAGTPYFMAPEVIRGERPSAASDIYAFGLLIDEMVTRSRAFAAASPNALYAQRLEGRPSSPSARSSGLPPEWDAAILQCLERDPARRFPSAGAAYDVLRGGGPASGFQDAPTCSAAVRAARPVRRRLALAVIALSLVALLLAASAFVARPLGASVVVYQTANVTKGPEYDYVCKGMWSELIRRLSQIPGLSVVPYYEARGKAPHPEIHAGFELDSQLEGWGRRIRFAVRLIQQSNGKVVWADAIDREMGDPLEMQSYIAAHVMEVLERQSLFGDHRGAGARLVADIALPLRRIISVQALPRPPTTSSAALDAYMLGRHLWEERTIPGSLEAIQHFERALAIDPNFALAFAALADVYLVLIQDNYAPATELLSRAERNASQSVAIAPDLAEAHLSLAAVRQSLWEWRAAEESYLTALRIRPELGRAHLWYAGLLLQLGRFDEMLNEARRGLELDPYNDAAQSAFGYYLFYAGHPHDAAAHLEQLLARREFLYARVNLANVYAKLGSAASGGAAAAYFNKAFEQARIVERTESENASRLQQPPPILRYTEEVYARLDALARRNARSGRHLDALEREMEAGRMSPAILAEIYTALGQYDRALDLLEQAADRKDPAAADIKVNPFLEPLRGSERFKELVKRMQL